MNETRIAIAPHHPMIPDGRVEVFIDGLGHCLSSPSNQDSFKNLFTIGCVIGYALADCKGDITNLRAGGTFDLDTLGRKKLLSFSSCEFNTSKAPEAKHASIYWKADGQGDACLVFFHSSVVCGGAVE